MPIENLESTNREPIFNNQYPLFQGNNTVEAVSKIIKHPSIMEVVLLIGFVVDDKIFNNLDFSVCGKIIQYREPGGDLCTPTNKKIYEKVIFDNKKSAWTDFGQDKELMARHKGGSYKLNSDLFSKKRYKYYMFDSISSENAECAADEIFALCKCREAGKFHYYIFCLNEITPVE